MASCKHVEIKITVNNLELETLKENFMRETFAKLITVYIPIAITVVVSIAAIFFIGGCH